MVNSSMQTLKGFVAIYDDLPSSLETFRLFIPVLLELSSKLLLKSLKSAIIETLNLIHKTVDGLEKFRQPLQMRLKKPTPIKQFNPKFEEDFVKGRDYDIDQRRHEAKGAARELRKDNPEKIKDRAEAEQILGGTRSRSQLGRKSKRRR